MTTPYAGHGEQIRRHERAGHDTELWPSVWHCWDCDIHIPMEGDDE